MFRTIISKFIGKDYYKDGRNLGENFKTVIGVNGLQALKNPVGEVVTDSKYKIIHELSYGMFRVVGRNGKFGFINKKGEEIWPCKFSYAQDFEEKVAIVGDDKKYGVVNKNGIYVLPKKFNDIEIVNNVIIAKEKYYWHAFTVEGQIISNYDLLPPLPPSTIYSRGLNDNMSYECLLKRYSELVSASDTPSYVTSVYKVLEEQNKYLLAKAKTQLNPEQLEKYQEQLELDLNKYKTVVEGLRKEW